VGGATSKWRKTKPKEAGEGRGGALLKKREAGERAYFMGTEGREKRNEGTET